MEAIGPTGLSPTGLNAFGTGLGDLLLNHWPYLIGLGALVNTLITVKSQ